MDVTIIKMAIRKIPFLAGEYYHIYNRGVDSRIIFKDEYDYERFMVLLHLCNGKNTVDMRNYSREGKSFAKIFSVDMGDKLVDIGAYCLMPNHFHILIYERIEGGISMFMKKISTAYSMYFNRKYERKGGLLDRPFKAKHIDKDPYLNWVFSYIHLNPVKIIDSSWKENGILNPVKAEKFMKEYKYSSYYDYFIDNREESIILKKDVFPEHFGELNNFKYLVQEFKNNNNQF